MKYLALSALLLMAGCAKHVESWKEVQARGEKFCQSPEALKATDAGVFALIGDTSVPLPCSMFGGKPSTVINQSTTGNCSGIIADAHGNFNVTCGGDTK